MLYNWSGAAYRSKQVDVAAVIVEAAHEISMWEQSGTYKIRPAEEINLGKPLWQCEGFASREDMDAWFREVVKPGQVVTKHLMRFRLLNIRPLAPADNQTPTQNGHS